MAGNQPAAVLFVEHPAVGKGKGLPQGGCLLRTGKAKGHDDRHIAGMFVVMPEHRPDLFQDPRGIAQIAPGQQHGELVAADAEAVLGPVKGLPDAAGCTAEQFVTGTVAVLV